MKWTMTQIPSARGEIMPVTAVKVGDNVVSQVKTARIDGYNSCQIAFGNFSEKSSNKPLLGHLGKQNLAPKRYLREIRGMEGFEPGSTIDLSIFKEGDKIKVTGVSRGKGFAGVTKRYGFALGAMSHGGGYPHRLIGSMGGGRGSNQGVPKGKKMPGRMGTDKVTQQATVEKVDLKNQLIFIRGSVPGPRKGLLILRKSL